MKCLKKLISLAMAATCLSTTVTSSVGASFNLPNGNQIQQTATTDETQEFVLLEDTELRKHYTEKLQLGDVTEELNVILETAADFPFTKENSEFLRDCIKGAIQAIYKKFNVYPKLNDIYIKIDDEICKKKNALAQYNIFNSQVLIQQCLLGEKRSELCSTLAHELTHKYLRERFGIIPNWFDEGIATQHDFDDDYGINALEKIPEWGKENFKFQYRYPNNEKDIAKFYIYNHYFFKKLLSQNESSFEKLLKDIEEKIKLTQLCSNPIFFSCVMKNGGDKILKANNIDINALYKEIRRDAIKKNIPLASFKFLSSPVGLVALVILIYGGIIKILPPQFRIPFLVGDFTVGRVINIYNYVKSKKSLQEKTFVSKSKSVKNQDEKQKEEKKPKREKDVQKHSKKATKSKQKSGGCTLL